MRSNPAAKGGRTEKHDFRRLMCSASPLTSPSGDNHRRKKLTSKFSRAALIAGLAIGASGLVAVPAEAANGVSTANYYVNNPAIGAASNITPESAIVSAVDRHGRQPGVAAAGPERRPDLEPHRVDITVTSREVERRHGSEPDDRPATTRRSTAFRSAARARTSA